MEETYSKRPRGLRIAKSYFKPARNYKKDIDGFFFNSRYFDKYFEK